MMKVSVSMLAVCLSATLSGSAVSSIAISQDAATARVTVTYNLDVDAIVTLDSVAVLTPSTFTGSSLSCPST